MARGKLADNSFVSSFISTCVAKGKSSHTQVCEEASLKIKEIDQRLAEVQELKKERSNLTDVLNLFGGLVQERQQNVVEKGYAIGNMDEEFAQSLCRVVADNDDACSLEEMIEELGEENRVKVYHTIKVLGSMRVLDRDAEKKFIPGNNWSEFVVDDDQD
jgi:hypothetical protein